MANPPDTLDAQLNSLYQAYAQQIPNKVSQIEDAWVQVPVNSWDGESFKTLHRLTHSLNGTTGSFGFMAVSEAAQPLEALFKSLMRGTTAATEEQRQQINAMLLMLKRAAAEAKQSALTMPGLPTAPRAK
ncbi:MAG: Hpt domain-containing protein, partial [Chloroflexi bacterium]|nr:Hpt domain-containing protein [Chloroflexota bacterium]